MNKIGFKKGCHTVLKVFKIKGCKRRICFESTSMIVVNNVCIINERPSEIEVAWSFLGSFLGYLDFTFE